MTAAYDGNDAEHVCTDLGCYVLGKLEASEHWAVGAHVAQCESCRETCQALQEVVDLLALLTKDDIDQLRRSY